MFCNGYLLLVGGTLNVFISLYFSLSYSTYTFILSEKWYCIVWMNRFVDYKQFGLTVGGWWTWKG